MLKAEQIRAMTDDELKEKVAQLRKELMGFRFQLKTGKLEKQSVIRTAKHDIARILTVLQSRKQAEVKS